MRIIKLLLVVVTLGVAQFSFAAEKVAVFDPQTAIGNTKMAQESAKKLNANPEYAKMIAQFESLNADLQQMNKEKESKGMTWSAEQVSAHNKKEQYILADRELVIKKIQAENSAASQQIMQELQPILQKVLQKIIESEGIDVLIHKNAVAYAAPAVDITDKITTELDKAK